MELSGVAPLLEHDGSPMTVEVAAPGCAACGAFRDAHRAVFVALATGSSEREPVEHPPSGGA